MTGFIRKEFGLSVGQNRVGNALATVCPRNHQQRREGTFRQINPIPYRADYFGHKIHFDQNEKLVMYRVSLVVAIDCHLDLSRVPIQCLYRTTRLFLRTFPDMFQE